MNRSKISAMALSAVLVITVNAPQVLAKSKHSTWLASQSSTSTSTTTTTSSTTPTSSTSTSSTTTTSSTSTSPAMAPKMVMGFYTVYYTGDNTSYNSLSAYGSQMNSIATMTWNATSTGSLTGSAPSNAMTLAATDGVSAYAAITNETNGSYDPNLAHTIISSPTLRQTLAAKLLSVVKASGYKGVDVDFENMYAADRPYYTQFVTDIETLLHQNGYRVIVSVPAKTADAPTSSWSGVYDYAGLGSVADNVDIMTYDEHGPWSSPGPVAGYPWVQSVVQYAMSTMPANKILLGLPAYGYDWNLTTNVGNKAVAWKNIPGLISTTGAAPVWDSTSQSPYFDYTASDGSQHVVWYENAASITAKTKLVNQDGLGGVAMWRMGIEDANFWNAVQTGLTP